MSKKFTQEFKKRENNDNRIEALSDGIFALAIAILLLSTNAPSNYQELRAFVIDLIPFGLSSLYIFWIWKEQKDYFKRFGLYDKKSTFLNLLLLLFTISFAFPLKFLMSWVANFFSSVINGNITNDFEYFNSVIPFDKLNSVMVIYGIGFICVFGTLFLMYQYAFSKTEELNLSMEEKHEILFIKKGFLTNVGIACFSVGLSILGRFFNWHFTPFFAGISYNLIWIFEIIRTRARNKKIAEINSK